MIGKHASRPVLAFVTAAAVSLTGACGPAVAPKAECPPAGEKWLRRAKESLQSADVEEARDASQKALAACPIDDVRLVAGKVALARLDYAEAVRLLKGVKGTEAAGLRGRALWYKGELDAAADELEQLLDDPDVKDDWAKSISKLARRGTGRKPFAMSGALLAAVDMPHVSPTMPVFLVPLEIDGESALGMIATATAEVVLDSATRSEPSWVSLRFGEKLEIADVPAMAQDLSGLSRQIGAPIKALLGVNLLRHMNVTLDYGGRQFVVRTFVPPKPPSATRVDLAYLRGGGMILGAGLGSAEGSRSPLLVDTSMSYPMALDAGGWKKLGVDPTSLPLIPDDPSQKLREGPVPMVRLGAFDVPRVPAMFGAPLETVEKALGADLDGIVGAGLLSHFRVTLGDGGRFLWLEEQPGGRPAPVAPPPGTEAPAPAPAPTPQP